MPLASVGSDRRMPGMERPLLRGDLSAATPAYSALLACAAGLSNRAAH
jgi:hypothetical protein